jgi:hypothetical protein
METYKRVHMEDRRTIVTEVIETNRALRTRLLTQEAGKCSMTVGVRAGSLEDAEKLADKAIANDHTCDDRCGQWERRWSRIIP